MRSSNNSNSEKNVKLEANYMFFLELLKRCSKNTCYGHPYGVEIKLSTSTTVYTT